MMALFFLFFLLSFLIALGVVSLGIMTWAFFNNFRTAIKSGTALRKIFE